MIRRTAAAALVVAPVVLAGCGLQPPGAAAVVGDDVVTVDQLQDAQRDIAALAQGGESLPQSQVLSYLVLAPFVVEEAASRGVGVSAADAASQLEAAGEPSEAGVRAVRSALSVQRLNGELEQGEAQEAYESVVEQVESLDVEVNPRYGTFDLQTLSVAPDETPWLVPDPAADPEEAAGAPTPAAP